MDRDDDKRCWTCANFRTCGWDTTGACHELSAVLKLYNEKTDTLTRSPSIQVPKNFCCKLYRPKS